MRESAPTYLARCHCGALTARYQTDLAPSRWSVRADQCSFCRAHGAAMTSDPAGALEFAATDPARLSRYQFGTRTADFLLCGHCGIFLGGTMTHQGRRFGVLNTRALTPSLPELPSPQAVDFEGETLEARLLRRATRWTPLALSSL